MCSCDDVGFRVVLVSGGSDEVFLSGDEAPDSAQNTAVFCELSSNSLYARDLQVAIENNYNLSKIAGPGTIFIVTGCAVWCELFDRPLAETLRKAIDSRSPGLDFRRAIVVGDRQWLDDATLQGYPVISIGGPAVNAMTKMIIDNGTMLTSGNETHACYQEENGQLRLAIWGTDAELTRKSVYLFIDDPMGLESLIKKCWAWNYPESERLKLGLAGLASLVKALSICQACSQQLGDTYASRHEVLRKLSRIARQTYEGMLRFRIAVADAKGQILKLPDSCSYYGPFLLNIPEYVFQQVEGEFVHGFSNDRVRFQKYSPWDWHLFIEEYWYLPRPALPSQSRVARPEDAPQCIKEITLDLLNKAEALCLKYIDGAAANVGQAQTKVVDEIQLIGQRLCGCCLQAQITIVDGQGIRTYHVQEDLIGAAIDSATLERCRSKDGWFLGNDISTYPWRQTLWRYRYVSNWGWLILVEGHWFST